jgi:hypothetical protein
MNDKDVPNFQHGGSTVPYTRARGRNRIHRALPAYRHECHRYIWTIDALGESGKLIDHPVHLKFDPKTRRHWHFCPEAGRVMVEDEGLATTCVDPEWVLDWLVTALPITPPVVRRRVLVPALAWHLGNAHIGGTELAVVFAICRETRLCSLLPGGKRFPRSRPRECAMAFG